MPLTREKSWARARTGMVKVYMIDKGKRFLERNVKFKKVVEYNESLL